MGLLSAEHGVPEAVEDGEGEGDDAELERGVEEGAQP